MVASGSHHSSVLRWVQLQHPNENHHPQTLRSDHRPRLNRWVLCTQRAYIKSTTRGRGWRSAVGLGGAISAGGDANRLEHFRGAAGALARSVRAMAATHTPRPAKDGAAWCYMVV